MKCRLAVAGALLALSACSILPEAETIEFYQLPPSSIGRSAKPERVAATLRVATPEASRIASGTRILVMRQSNQLSAYKGARWADAAPVLLRNRLVSAFRADGRMGVVAAESAGLNADRELDGELVAFQVEYRGGRAFVHIQLEAALVDPAGRRVVAARGFDVAQPVDGEQLPQVVEAFGAAADKLAAQIIEWTLAP